MDQRHSMKDLKARMVKHGVCTNFAVQQMLVAERIQYMNKHREEEDTADWTEELLSRKISPHTSTILHDERFRASAFRRRSDENLQKLVWLQPAGQPPSKQPQHHIIYEEQSTNNEHPQQRILSLFGRFPSKHIQPALQRKSVPAGGSIPANSTIATSQIAEEILVDFSTSRRHGFYSKPSQRHADTTVEHQSSNQPHHERSRSVGSDEGSTNNTHPQGRRFSLGSCYPSKPRKSRRNSFSCCPSKPRKSRRNSFSGSSASNSSTSTTPQQKSGEILVDFSTSRRWRSKHSQRQVDTTKEHQSGKQLHHEEIRSADDDDERSTENKLPRQQRCSLVWPFHFKATKEWKQFLF